MNRRRVVALVFGLVVCAVLLGRWAIRPDDNGDMPAPTEERVALDDPAAHTSPDLTPSTLPAAPAKKTSDSPALGIFRGRIVDALTRKPVHEFDLQLHGPPSTRPESDTPLTQSFQSEDGKFEWRGIPAGSWLVFATARGYQRFEFEGLQIASGAATREIVLPMRPGYAVRGHVYDESTRAGIGSAELSFRESHVRRYEGAFRYRPSVSSQQDGSFIGTDKGWK